MEETHVVDKIICSLQNKFHYMVVAIEESQNIDVLSIQSLMGKLQGREKRVNEIQEDAGAQAFFPKQNGSGYSQEGRGHGQTKRSGKRRKFGGGGNEP